MQPLERRFDLVDIRGIEREHVAGRQQASFDRVGEMAVDCSDLHAALGCDTLRVETAQMRRERLVHRRRETVVQQRVFPKPRDDVEESGAVARDLAGAKAGDIVQREFALRALLRKFDQRAILRDNVGRKLCAGREAQPQRLKRIEQRGVLRRDARRRFRLALGPARRFARDPHQELVVAAQQRPCAVGQPKGAVPVFIARQIAAGDELAEQAFPCGRCQILADAEDRHAVMPIALDALVGFAHQNVDDVADAETLPRAIDGG